MTNVKTVLFSQFDIEKPENKRFKDDLDMFLGLTPEQQEQVLRRSADFALASIESDERKVVRNLETELTCSPAEAKGLLALGYFLLKQLRDPDVAGRDSAEGWAADLAEMKVLVDDDKRNAFVRSVAFLKEQVFPGYSDSRRRRAAVNGVFPSFKACGFTVEVRTIVGSPFKFGMSALEYEPEIVDSVPLVSIAIGTDSGSPDQFCFQCDESDLDLLIQHLEAARKELVEAKGRLHLE